MESRNKLGMCRLCLCQNECFVNIFERNDWQGYVAAEVISDLLQFQVSETDGYPHVVCSTCLTKLTEFRLFKECCRKSKVTYDGMFISRGSLVEYKPEMVEFVTVKVEPICYSDNEDNDSKVQVTAEDTVAYPHNLQCLEHEKPHCSSKGAFGAGSSSMNVSTDDESAFEKSRNVSLSIEAESSDSLESSDGRWIPSGNRMYMDYQHNIGIVKEEGRGRKEKEMGGEWEGGRETAEEEIVEGERRLLECCHCGKIFTSKDVLKHHMKMHGYDNSYDCEVCGKAFPSGDDLMRHVLMHTGTKPYKCEECSKCFSKNSNLKTHMRLHTGSKEYKCGECSKCFSTNGSLKRHMILHTGSKPFKCSECSKVFGDNNNLKRHMKIHTGSKKYECAECNKCFSQYCSLKIHMRLHSGSQSYKCTECSKSFSDTRNLKRHMMSHTGIKPYKCTECSKSFSQNSSLKKHIRTHTGYKPYKCAECSKSFSDNSNLQQHMRLHTGSKPYKCAECGKCFSKNYNLKMHMQTHRL